MKKVLLLIGAVLIMSCSAVNNILFPATPTPTCTPTATLTATPSVTSTPEFTPTPEFNIVGDWRLAFDWDCAENPNYVGLRFKADGTMAFKNDSGSWVSAGSWTLEGNRVTITLNNGTEYEGTVQSGNRSMKGTMVSNAADTKGNTGCWTAERVD